MFLVQLSKKKKVVSCFFPNMEQEIIWSNKGLVRHMLDQSLAGLLATGLGSILVLDGFFSKSKAMNDKTCRDGLW